METAHSSSPDVSHEGSGVSIGVSSGGGGGGVATLGIPGGIINPGGGFDINDFFKFADTMAVSWEKLCLFVKKI